MAVSEVELSFCVVNTEQRELLVRCLDAVAAERDAQPFRCEVLVLDNASRDGSAGAARHHATTDAVIVNEERRGKGENDTALLRRATGRYCLLLNEDSELRPGAVAALHEALTASRRPGPPARCSCAPTAAQQPSAWRFPSPRTALIGALFLHRRLTVQSTGTETREVDWAQSAALLVDRAAAAEIGWFDPAFFVYSDEVDFCKRLREAGRSVLYVPSAVCAHHEQLSTGPIPERRIVELSRNRDRYMRKHHSAAPRAACAGSPPGPTASGPWRRRAPRPRPAALLAPRARHAAPRARRGPARGRLRAQPRRPAALAGSALAQEASIPSSRRCRPNEKAWSGSCAPSLASATATPTRTASGNRPGGRNWCRTGADLFHH